MASQQISSSSAGASNMHEEFTVRIPKDKRKAFTMMKFGTASNVDFAKMGEQPVKLERENNLKEYKTANDIDMLPKFGAGSEYGRELKEESRRKKYGIMLKRYHPEDQPWILKLGGGKQGKRYKGVREGTIAENTSYYIFTKAADGAFEAFPVGEWYNFSPIIKYKYLNSEEAEEEFTRRDKTLNYFNIMLKKRLRKEDDKDIDDDDDEEGGKKNKKGKKKSKSSRNMILTDMDEWNDLELSDDDDDNDEDGEDDANNGANKKKKTKTKRKQKVTKNSKKNSDDEAIEESDEGDFDDREVDYISDSGSSDSLSGPEVDDKDKNQEKGVDEEKGLRTILDSGAEDEDEEEREKEDIEEETEEKEKKEDKVKKGDDSSSSSSDDDSDIEKNMASAIFMQRDKNEKKEKKDNAEPEATTSAETPTTNATDKKEKDKGLKRKGEKNLDGKSQPSKKHKGDDTDGITEDAIRRYLTRKPMTTKDLVQKFRSKKLNITNEKITHTIAQLLKKLNPEKTTINKKLYLSLKKAE